MSVVNISKKASIIRLSDGDSLAIFNSYITEDMATKYYFYTEPETELKNYQYTLDLTQSLNQRCMQYRMFNPTSASNQNNKVVLSAPQYITSGAFEPIYQAIDVSVDYNQSDGIMSATFWSNTDMSTGIQVEQNADRMHGSVKKVGDKYIQYFYNSELIKKYKHDNYKIFEAEGDNYSIFCNALLSIDVCKVINQEQFDAKISLDSIDAEQVVISNTPIIIEQFNDLYPIIDFAGTSGNSSGGGMRNHYHIPTIDGSNYAFAVLHPGTAVPQLPWQTL